MSRSYFLPTRPTYSLDDFVRSHDSTSTKYFRNTLVPDSDPFLLQLSLEPFHLLPFLLFLPDTRTPPRLPHEVPTGPPFSDLVCLQNFLLGQLKWVYMIRSLLHTNGSLVLPRTLFLKNTNSLMWLMKHFQASPQPLHLNPLIVSFPFKFQLGQFLSVPELTLPCGIRSAPTLVIWCEQPWSPLPDWLSVSCKSSWESQLGSFPIPALGCKSPCVSMTTALTAIYCHCLLNCLFSPVDCKHCHISNIHRCSKMG